MHPQRGPIAAAEFIPLAEETGLIVPIGAWVLREACRQMKDWQDRLRQPQLHVSVNVSSRQFQEPGLVLAVAEALEETGLSPGSLRLEVPENALMVKDPRIAATIVDLRGMGVRIDVDDFGTGYAAISYLHAFPVDILKIDKKFVQRLEMADDGLEVVNSILALATSLDLEVVAEGVESAGQLRILRKLQCGYAQGYGLSRPIAAAEFEQMLAEERTFIP
jgi:EAL domain-containing protein (putative c-di-GMP-specific phosphodiesterase class I)